MLMGENVGGYMYPPTFWEPPGGWAEGLAQQALPPWRRALLKVRWFWEDHFVAAWRVLINGTEDCDCF
jgi:hypothetical protein